MWNVVMGDASSSRSVSIYTWSSACLWHRALAILIGVYSLLLIAVLTVNIERPRVFFTLIITLSAGVGTFGFALARIFRQIHREQNQARRALQATRERLKANLQISNSVLAEGEALRNATLALTQDLHMNHVMDALLKSLAEVVPFSCARVLVPEGGPHWLALGERNCPENTNPGLRVPWTFIDDKCALVRRVAKNKKSVMIPDTKKELDWPAFKGHKHLRSWLSVPLVSSKQYLGFLSVGHVEPNKFTGQHLRRAQLLAVPVAIAIESARLYARSEIFASELTKRVSELQAAESALVRAEGGRRVWEDRFKQLFHSSPIPISITTFKEGKFLYVNPAFESSYGYARHELLGRRVQDIGIWGDASDLAYLDTCLEKGPMRNLLTRLRTKTGQIKIAAYSADAIEFNGQECILAVCEDVLQYDPRMAN